MNKIDMTPLEYAHETFTYARKLAEAAENLAERLIGSFPVPGEASERGGLMPSGDFGALLEDALASRMVMERALYALSRIDEQLPPRVAQTYTTGADVAMPMSRGGYK